MRLRTLLAALTATCAYAQPSPEKATVIKRMDASAQAWGEVSRRIWEFAEVGYKETQSADLLKSRLRESGFQIQDRIGGIPTAFMATWGQGRPVIAILGEYDALPGLSQQDVPERRPRAVAGPGHGCGHNLLGAASAFAAVSVKQWLAEREIRGTVRFYGTPAEEGGGGKIYMARAGAFEGVDVALTWHPGSENRASKRSTLANITGKFRYHGRAAHAASAPEAGRSALDALQLANHCIDMLREHVPTSARMHYIVTAGGAAPNVVPDFTEGYYYARHSSMPALDNIWARMVKCAEAGALGTETKLEVEVVNSVYNVLPNDALSALLDRNLRALGGIKYSPQEQAFAEALRKTLDTEDRQPLGSQEQVQPPDEGPGSGSTDVGDVSWMLPTAQFTTATYVPGTPGHSWQSAACSGMSIGRKGMVLAAKTLALTAMDILADPRQVDAARESFRKRKGAFEYRSRIPADRKPPLGYRDRP
jgi:aminobenzoyl-glutamate utilization protein B